MEKNNGYDLQKDQINTLDTRAQTTIFRPRIGYCGLKKHLKRLSLADSARCECDSEEQILSTSFRPAHTWRQYTNTLARRHRSGHRTLVASCQTAMDSGPLSCHQPEDLAQSSLRTQKYTAQSFAYTILPFGTPSLLNVSPLHT